MPIHSPYWTEFLSCPICFNRFSVNEHRPISLGCSHTYCIECIKSQYKRQCPIDQSIIPIDIDDLPINFALAQLVINSENDKEVLNNIEIDFNSKSRRILSLRSDDLEYYLNCVKCISKMALYLRSSQSKNITTNMLSLSVQKKLVSVINCQLLLEEGRIRALRAALSLAERIVTELILQFQNPQHLSSNLWAAVRSRGCQFLGPAMQEEVLKLVLLALEDGSSLSRKVLVMFVVQRLETQFPQASKTSIGHVVQLLYRASCFKVSKRDGDSSLMQLKEIFRTYDALRKEHDAQIAQIAIEAGLRIAPDQWSLLLYGDTAHKSHMQSIIRKLQTPPSFAQSVQELLIAAQRSANPSYLNEIHRHLTNLSELVPCTEPFIPTWKILWNAIEDTCKLIKKLVEYIKQHGYKKPQECAMNIGNSTPKYKVSFCHYLSKRGVCPRGNNCTFAHSDEELEKYRAKGRRNLTSTSKPNAIREVPNLHTYKTLNNLCISSSSNYIKSIIQSSKDSYVNFPPARDSSAISSLSSNSTTRGSKNNLIVENEIKSNQPSNTHELSILKSNEEDKKISLHMSKEMGYKEPNISIFSDRLKPDLLTFHHITEELNSPQNSKAVLLPKSGPDDKANTNFQNSYDTTLWSSANKNSKLSPHHIQHSSVEFSSLPYKEFSPNQFESSLKTGYQFQDLLKKVVSNCGITEGNSYDDYYMNSSSIIPNENYLRLLNEASEFRDENCDNIKFEPKLQVFKDSVFIRSDSILDTDEGSCEVSLSSPSLGNKYGPIRPKYKGDSRTSYMMENNSNAEHSDKNKNSNILSTNCEIDQIVSGLEYLNRIDISQTSTQPFHLEKKNLILKIKEDKMSEINLLKSSNYQIKENTDKANYTHIIKDEYNSIYNREENQSPKLKESSFGCKISNILCDDVFNTCNE